jgi:hypothetical protein
MTAPESDLHCRHAWVPRITVSKPTVADRSLARLFYSHFTA